MRPNSNSQSVSDVAQGMNVLEVLEVVARARFALLGRIRAEPLAGR
jgi:hypothetical protein